MDIGRDDGFRFHTIADRVIIQESEQLWLLSTDVILMNGDDPCWVYGMIGELERILVLSLSNSQLGVLLIAVRFHDVLAQPELLRFSSPIFRWRTQYRYSKELLLDVIQEEGNIKKQPTIVEFFGFFAAHNQHTRAQKEKKRNK